MLLLGVRLWKWGSMDVTSPPRAMLRSAAWEALDSKSAHAMSALQTNSLVMGVASNFLPLRGRKEV